MSTLKPAEAVAELNTTAADGHPNLRRNGLEIFFFSNRHKRSARKRALLTLSSPPRSQLGSHRELEWRRWRRARIQLERDDA